MGDKKTLLEGIEGLVGFGDVHIEVAEGMEKSDAAVVAAQVAKALGTPVEIFFTIGGRTDSVKFS